MGPHQTVKLFVELARKGPIYEMVFVDPLGAGRYRVHASPALLAGLAAGDEFELDPNDPTRFRLLLSGGNVSIQLFRGEKIDEVDRFLEPRIEALGGWADQKLARVHVYTVPRAAVGRAEAVLAEARRSFPDLDWILGNVEEG